MTCSLKHLRYVIKIFPLKLLVMISIVNFKIAVAGETKPFKDMMTDFDYLVSQLYVQHCTFVEIGEGMCSLFIEMTLDEGRTNSCRKVPKEQIFFGNCMCEEFRKWHLCSFQLTNQRRRDCEFKEATSCPTTSARVHRRLCDVTGMSQWNPQCNCSVPLNGRAQNPMCGFKTCYSTPMPKSICSPRTACGIDNCDIGQHGSLYSIKCDGNCKYHQPFCEHPGPATSAKRSVKSEWSEWKTISKAENCNIQQAEAECLSEWNQPAFDCIGPGLLCCGEENGDCICEVKLQDGRLKAFRYMIGDTFSNTCHNSKIKVRSALLQGDPKVWDRFIGTSSNDSEDSLSLFARPQNTDGPNAIIDLTTKNSQSSPAIDLIPNSNQKNSHQVSILTNEGPFVIQSDGHSGILADKIKVHKTTGDIESNENSQSEISLMNKNDEFFGLKPIHANSTNILVKENELLKSTKNQLSSVNNSTGNISKKQPNLPLIKENLGLRLNLPYKLLPNNSSYTNQNLNSSIFSFDKIGNSNNENKKILNKQYQVQGDKQIQKDNSNYQFTASPTPVTKTENSESNSKQDLVNFNKNMKSNDQSKTSTVTNNEIAKGGNETHKLINYSDPGINNKSQDSSLSQNISFVTDKNEKSNSSPVYVNNVSKQLFDILKNPDVSQTNNDNPKNQSLSHYITKNESIVNLQNSKVINNNIDFYKNLSSPDHISTNKPVETYQHSEVSNKSIDYSTNQSPSDYITKNESEENNLRSKQFQKTTNLNSNESFIDKEILSKNKEINNNNSTNERTHMNENKKIILQDKVKTNKLRRRDHIFHGKGKLNLARFIGKHYRVGNGNKTLKSQKGNKPANLKAEKDKKNHIQKDKKIVQVQGQENISHLPGQTQVENNKKVNLKRENVTNKQNQFYQDQNIINKNYNNQNQTMAGTKDKMSAEENKELKHKNKLNLKVDKENHNYEREEKNILSSKFANQKITTAAVDKKEMSSNMTFLNNLNNIESRGYTNSSRNTKHLQGHISLVEKSKNNSNSFSGTNSTEVIINQNLNNNTKAMAQIEEKKVHEEGMLSKLTLNDNSLINDMDDTHDINDKFKAPKETNKHFESHNNPTNKDSSQATKGIPEKNNILETYTTPKRSEITTQSTIKQLSTYEGQTDQHGISLNIQLTTPDLIAIIAKDFLKHNENPFDHKDYESSSMGDKNSHNTFYDEPEPVLKDLNKVGKDIVDEKVTNALDKILKGLNQPSGKIVWSEVNIDKDKNNVE